MNSSKGAITTCSVEIPGFSFPSSAWERRSRSSASPLLPAGKQSFPTLVPKQSLATRVRGDDPRGALRPRRPHRRRPRGGRRRLGRAGRLAVGRGEVGGEEFGKLALVGGEDFAQGRRDLGDHLVLGVALGAGEALHGP